MLCAAANPAQSLPPSWPTRIGVSGLVLGSILLLPLAFLFYGYVRSLYLLPPNSHRAVIVCDALLRTLALTLLFVGSLQLLRRKRTGPILLAFWALIWLAWPVCSFYLFVGIGPSPEFIAALLPAAIYQSLPLRFTLPLFNLLVTSIYVLAVVAVWLTPPIFLLKRFISQRHQIRKWGAL